MANGVFLGLGITYLAFIMFIIISIFRDGRGTERMEKGDAANKIEFEYSEDQSDIDFV